MGVSSLALETSQNFFFKIFFLYMFFVRRISFSRLLGWFCSLDSFFFDGLPFGRLAFTLLLAILCYCLPRLAFVC